MNKSELGFIVSRGFAVYCFLRVLPRLVLIPSYIDLMKDSGSKRFWWSGQTQAADFFFDMILFTLLGAILWQAAGPIGEMIAGHRMQKGGEIPAAPSQELRRIIFAAFSIFPLLSAIDSIHGLAVRQSRSTPDPSDPWVYELAAIALKLALAAALFFGPNLGRMVADFWHRGPLED